MTDQWKRRVEADLEQAARIQKDLLPKGSPRLEGFDIGGSYVSCYEVGGDYYDFIPVDADRLGVAVADVAGKGIAAALHMASLRAALLAEVRPGSEIGPMAARLSEFVYKSSGPTGFITFFFAELDRRTGGMRYVNAGHNPPFVLRRDGRVLTLPSSGFALGMFPEAAYEAGETGLGPGDLAVLFTDGIPEGRDAGGMDYTVERLVDFIGQRRDRTADEICRAVLEDVHGHAGAGQPCDDMTIVVIKRDDAGA
jgi:sigma-B regulation protein RsbU (phosphoserine phosphatase)